MVYKIEIVETLSKTVEIEAETREQALKEVKQKYKNEEVVLGESNFIGVEFEPVIE